MEEERILIRVIEPECKFSELHETTAGGFTEVDLMCGKQKHTKCNEEQFAKCKCKELNGLSRQEAISCMAKAEYRAEYGRPFELADGLTKSVFLIKAEAALNALLEMQNER